MINIEKGQTYKDGKVNLREDFFATNNLLYEGQVAQNQFLTYTKYVTMK